jgi:hypothetical protein
MRAVRLFDFIEYDACSWQVVAQDGPMLALKNLSTNRIRRVAVGACQDNCVSSSGRFIGGRFS